MGTVTLPPGQSAFPSFDVGPTFAVSSHVVKYAHHPGGRAHFSLDGKVRTTGIRAAVPLAEVGGHLFSVRVQGMDAFRLAEANERTSRKRDVIRFDADGATSLTFVAHLYRLSDLGKLIRFGSDPRDAWLAVQRPDGRLLQGVVLATRYYDKTDRRFILLACETEDFRFVSNIDGPVIGFTGGFDAETTVRDPSREMSFLMMFAHRMDVGGDARPNVDFRR